MNVRNVHQRALAAPAAEVGALVDSLASANDRLWPHRRWPAMRFDGALRVGARGGHGPVRYFVEAYEPSRSVVFRFEVPRGFVGTHGFEVAAGDGATILRHVLEVRLRGWAILSWPLVFRPLHDALLEDALATAARSLGLPAESPPWSPLVRFLRWALRRTAPRGARR